MNESRICDVHRLRKEPFAWEWPRKRPGFVLKLGGVDEANRYGDDVRQRATDYFHARRKQRISPAKICLELGIGMPTLRSWTLVHKTEMATANSGFERLAIVAAPPIESKKEFVVHGPGGLRIEGLDIESLAELIRRLS